MLENRLPFIATIIANIIVVGISYLYLEDYFYLTVFVAIVSISLLSKQFNPWALTASLLLALLPYAASKDDSTTNNVLWLLLIGGTILQIAVSLVTTRSAAEVRGSTLPFNTLFALLGVAFSYFLIFRVCQTQYGGSVQDEFEIMMNQFRTFIGQESVTFGEAAPTLGIASIGQIWWSIFECFLYYSFEPYLIYIQSGALADPAGQINWLIQLSAFAQSLGRAILLGPLTWAALFAAISEVRFRVYRFNDLIKRFFRGIFSINRYGCLTFIVLLALFGGQFAYQSVFPNHSKVLDYFSLGIMMTVLTSLSLGTAYSVTREK